MSDLKGKSLLLICLLWPIAPVTEAAQEARAVKAEAAPLGSSARDEALRVQIVLDRAGFRPGRLDGGFGRFTQLAADRYVKANGLPAGSLINTSSVLSPYTTYTVRKQDSRWVGPVSSSPARQATFKALKYGSLWELVAERYHTSLKFLKELNPELAEKELQTGDMVRVPNVTPFLMEDVIAFQQARKKGLPDPTPSPSPQPRDNRPLTYPFVGLTSKTFEPQLKTWLPPTFVESVSPRPDRASVADPEAPNEPVRLIIHRKDRIIEVWRGDQLIASMPCTPGSKKFPVKLGEWKITSNILMPYFRWDKSVLRSGVRSNNAHNLPPGPNSPVGIVWMGINRPSIGIHGTNSPDRIGRNQSSGCIRTANWDAFKLSTMVEKGTRVTVVE